MRKLLIVCFLGLFATLHSQENYQVSDIDPLLLINADAVIRKHDQFIEIKAIDKVEISTTRIVTVLNASGESYIDAYENFDKGISILDQEAIILDPNGRELRKYKKRDFRVRSNFENFVLFSDNKVSYLDHTPRSYPYTVKYTSRIRRGNTVFLPDWWPLEGYDVSVERTTYKIENLADIAIRYQERNLDSLTVVSNNKGNSLDYTATSIPAETYEKYSPGFLTRAPKVLVALEQYDLEGITGAATNWENFGKWQYENLVEGRGFLSDAIVSRVSELTKDVESMEEKARIIYQFVQDNTRYIAVMLGIGGWKPYAAAEVDRLGYGDCKGLTNYTRALLASQGIASDYTVIYGGPRRDIDPDFTKMQGNHVVLSIPREGEEDIWLECTNQNTPFNYLGDTTDDRYALKVKPDGGVIVRTPRYSAQDNLRETRAEILLNKSGGFTASIKRNSYGIPYGDIYMIELQTEDVQQNFYREHWSHFQNIRFKEISYTNNKRDIQFTEELELNADRFCRLAGERLLLPLSFTQTSFSGVGKDDHRRNKIEISRGKSFKDSFSFILPQGYVLEAMPADREINSDFGEIRFTTKEKIIDGQVTILVEKYIRINEGLWEPEKFEDFRKFLNQINNINNQKAVIVPTTKT